MSPGDASPFSASFRQRHCTFACASASSPVTARSCRSNRPSRALRADPLQRHPPDRFRLAPVAHATRIDKVYFDQAPLMRFSSPSALTGRDACCPGRPASGRSRFDVSACRRARAIRDRRRGVRPCGFPPGRTAAMVLDAWRTRAGGAFRSNPSPAPSPFDRRPARPRVDGLLLASRSSFRSPVRGGDGVPVLTTPTGDPTSSSAAAVILPPEPGHSPTRSLARRSKPASDSGTRGLTGAMGPSLVLAAGGAPGVRSLRRFHPAGGWACISAGPGPHAVRAHRPPRFIFVGVTGRLLEVSPEKRSAGDDMASASGLRFPSAIRFRGLPGRGSILPWALPLAGLRTRFRAPARARPLCGSSVSGAQAQATLPVRRPLSAHGLRASFPISDAFGDVLVEPSLTCGDAAPPSRAGPSAY
jgi:hypothetical protein